MPYASDLQWGSREGKGTRSSRAVLMQMANWHRLGELSGEAGKGFHLGTAGTERPGSVGYMPTHSLEEEEGEGPGEEEEADPERGQPTCLTSGACCTARHPETFNCPEPTPWQ